MTDPAVQPGKRVFYSLDGMRGIASILVVLRHTAGFFGRGAVQDSYLAVDLFFVLSGVVICYNYEHKLRSGLSAARFSWLRLVRIYPLYILGTILMLASVLTLHSTAHGTLDPNNLTICSLLALFVVPYLGASGLVLFPLNMPAWSLFEELIVNVVYAGTLRFLTKSNLMLIMLVSALGMVICAHVISALDIGWKNITWRGMNIGMIGGFFRVGYSFFMGVLLYRAFSRKQLIGQPGRYAQAVPWIILCAVAAILTASPSPSARPYFDLAAALVVFPALVYLALHFQPAGRSARICKFFGLVSYAVYAIHYPLSVFVQDLLSNKAGILVENAAPWAGFAFMLLLIPLCWVLDLIYDAPVRRFLNGLGKKKRGRKDVVVPPLIAPNT
jgi:peptidoglycan/LPS O-acetylase OafA/YrhL